MRLNSGRATVTRPGVACGQEAAGCRPVACWVRVDQTGLGLADFVGTKRGTTGPVHVGSLGPSFGGESGSQVQLDMALVGNGGQHGSTLSWPS